MSIETDFRALLLSHGALTALVGTRVAQDLGEGGYPAVAFSAKREPILDVSGAVLAESATLTVRCYGTTAEQAASVADAVSAAIASAPAAKGASVGPRETSYDPEAGIYDVTLTAAWWAF